MQLYLLCFGGEGILPWADGAFWCETWEGDLLFLTYCLRCHGPLDHFNGILNRRVGSLLIGKEIFILLLHSEDILKFWLDDKFIVCCENLDFLELLILLVNALEL